MAQTKEKLLFLFHPSVARGFEALEEQVEVVTLPEGEKFDPKHLGGLPKDATILGSEFTIPVTKEVIDYFPNLKLIANYAVGFNNIDVAYANSKGITVCNTPQAVIQPTAELTVALLLGLTRRIAIWDHKMRSQRSSAKGSLSDGMGTDIYRKKVGIVGYGNIGRAVGRILKAMGAEIFYYKRHKLSDEEARKEGVTYMPLDQLLRECDIISLHTPYNEDSHHLINEKSLGTMKSSAILVNTARGKVVDEAALVAALKNGTIAGAALDVFEHDDNPLDELYDMEKVVMTPHVGTQTVEARVAMAEEFTNNVLGYLLQDRPIAIVRI